MISKGIITMKTNKSERNGLSTLQLILIITVSIVAAVGIVFLVLTFLKKKNEKRAIKNCNCDELDEWTFDDDLLSDLCFDDEEYEEDCGCCHCHDDESEVSDELSAAVDEAIEAISSISDEDAE